MNDLLKEYFGFTSFREGQEEVIERILAGKSSLAVFPTGSGKSLCYQLPALLLEGVTLVVSPLIALMKDQVEGLQERGIKARNLDSTLSTEDALRVFRELESGELKILFVAPERFTNPSFLSRLKGVKISLLAIDEAHCISEWGHAFRPDYLKIAKGADELGISLRLALTATATPKVSKDICQSFQISQEDHIQTGFKRENLSYSISPVDEEDRDALLLKLVQAHPTSPTIIYVTRQMTTEHVTTFLNRKGNLNARSYHAGMGAEKRAEIQEEFMSGKVSIIVATIAFGMGIDKADVRYVYHYNLPKSFENYVQETGRAGRDGAPSECRMLACGADLGTLENFIFTKRPSELAIESLVYACLRGRETIALNRYDLSVSLDIKTEVIQTILVWLELGGYIESRGWQHGIYTVTLLRRWDDILAGHTAERQSFIKNLFTAGQRFKTNQNKYKFEVAEVAETLQEPQEKVAKALQWLETHGDLTLQPSQYLMLYQATEKGVSASKREVSKMIEEHFHNWEEMELGRLQQIIDLVEGEACIERVVLDYFGEESQPCGKCSSCLAHKEGSALLSRGENLEIQAEDLQVIKGLISERHPSLCSPRQLAKFLCGVTSPATTRARLTTKHDLFGMLEDHPFREVMEACEVVM